MRRNWWHAVGFDGRMGDIFTGDYCLFCIIVGINNGLLYTKYYMFWFFCLKFQDDH